MQVRGIALVGLEEFVSEAAYGAVVLLGIDVNDAIWRVLNVGDFSFLVATKVICYSWEVQISQFGNKHPKLEKKWREKEKSKQK